MVCLASGGVLAACGGGGDASTSGGSQLLAASTVVACVPWQEGGTYNAGTVVTYLGANYTALVTQTDHVETGFQPEPT